MARVPTEVLAGLTMVIAVSAAAGQGMRLSRMMTEPAVAHQDEILPPPRVLANGPVPHGVVHAPHSAAHYETAPLAVDDGGFRRSRWGPSGRFFLSWEYLYWWTQGQNTPPLITRGPAGTQASLAEPGTVVLSGGSRELDDPRSGARFTAGLWLTPGRRLGLEFRGFLLETASHGDGVASDDTANFGIPFASTAGTETSLLFASTAPGASVTGTAAYYMSSRFGGVEINPVFNAVNRGNFWLDLWLGFRFVCLDEDFRLTTFSQTQGAATLGFQGQQVSGSRTVSDFFGTRNEFYSGQFGGRAQWQRGPVILDLQSKIALGSMHEVAQVSGFTTATSATLTPNTQTVLRGLFAAGTNSGSRSRDVFAVAPEVNVNLGFQVTPRVRIFGGYTFLYLSNVIRPAEQIDRTVNPTQVPSFSAGPLAGPSRPASEFNDTDFWAHGVSAGLLLQF